MKDEKTGLELIGETNDIYKYIDHDNKTVIYIKGRYSSGYCMCCAPLLEKKDDFIDKMVNDLETKPTNLR